MGTLRSGGVDLVVGNRNKPQLLERVLNYLDKGDRGADAAPLRNSRHDLDQQWPEPSPETLSDDRIEIRSKKGQTERIRAFIKVQEGCDAFCTYCVIPYGRGPSRSVRTELLVEEVVRLEARGVREVVITGTNIGDFRGACGEIEGLIRTLLAATRVLRFRVSSLVRLKSRMASLSLPALRFDFALIFMFRFRVHRTPF